MTNDNESAFQLAALCMEPVRSLLQAEISSESVRKALEYLELYGQSNLFCLQGWQAAIREELDAIAAAIEELPPSDLVHLPEWYELAPTVTGRLLVVASRRPRAAIRMAPVILAQMMDEWDGVEAPLEGMDAVLVRAYPDLSPFEQEWAAEREGVRQALGLEPGVDCDVAAPDGEPWPPDRPLPPVESPAGIQVRLVELGFLRGPVTGAWDRRTKTALARLQYAYAAEPTGELNDRTREIFEFVI